MSLRPAEVVEFLGLVAKAAKRRGTARDLKRGAELLARSFLPEAGAPPAPSPAPLQVPPVVAVVQPSPGPARAPSGRPGEPREVPLVEVNGVWQRRR